MITFVEALYKANDNLKLGWNPEPGRVAASYRLYVGLVPAAASLTTLVSTVSAQASQLPGERGKVTVDVSITLVRSTLGLPVTVDFSNVLLYWAITYLDFAGAESAKSTVVEIPPVGITTRYMKDDPTINRHMWGFSDGNYRWVKAAASSNGGLITAASNYYLPNTVTEYTYDGTNLATTKTYLSDKTTAGSPAKLVSYTYSGSTVTRVAITDSTV